MSHTCHWPGCEVQVEEKYWGCRQHWFLLPASLRDRIWSAYRPGQEIDKKPSQAYLDAARAVQAWILERYGGTQTEANKAGFSTAYVKQGITASYYGSAELPPAALETMQRGQAELVQAFIQVEKKHGHQKAALAIAQCNAEQIVRECHKHGIAPYIVYSIKKSMEYVLTEWANLAKIDQADILPLVNGLREHIAIIDSDLKQTVTQGDSDAAEKQV